MNRELEPGGWSVRANADSTRFSILRFPVNSMSSGQTIKIQINGEIRRCPESQTVAELLETLGLKPKFVAVERNEELVPRAQHAECRLSAGDRIEIVTLVGGG